ncbi:peptide chain release factor N(5)-glutamine methyltransferase [Legionella spiritensis]|uniref:Release factor glutamine methyltransferase n=1 Tax=Legionella spiritensis TaxID=452 RepID=A0A0W0ZAF7_LEGSP|nr:peptide chain release factor N(5)-glutamine methyltransferase [Legionella spiritensis]KTD66103.1 protein methyltransferase HemK [Legionella spiritensis]SNV44168.1 HemK protein [Legionella spiritensis]
MIDIKNALSEGISQLNDNNPDGRIDVEVLLAHVLMKSRAYLFTHPEEKLTSVQWHTFRQLIAQRAHGYPVAYLTGVKEFWSLPLKVCEDTLIPRPETELLVELTLRFLKTQNNARILDLGTGSGAIALAIAKERPDWQIVACDISRNALQTAEENAARLKLGNVRFYHSNWFTNIDTSRRFHAIVANPPYIASEDPHLAKGDIRFEPQSALISGQQGLADLEHIIRHSLARLEPDGLLLVEHGYNQKTAVTSMLKEHGYEEIDCWQDWQGNDRVSGGKRIIVDASPDF